MLPGSVEYAGTLAPHPWDAVGAPPPLGKPYVVLMDLDGDVGAFGPDALRAAQLLRDADYERDRAREAEEDADDLEADANKLLKGLPAELVDAIRHDPDGVLTEEHVRAILEKRLPA